MLDFAQKRKVKGVLYSWVTIGILAVIALLFLHSTWSVYKKKTESEEARKTVSLRVDDLRARDTELKAKIERLDTEAGVEEEIRAKFSVARENEAMVVVVDDEAPTSSPVVHKETFWGRVWAWFTK